MSITAATSFGSGLYGCLALTASPEGRSTTCQQTLTDSLLTAPKLSSEQCPMFCLGDHFTRWFYCLVSHVL